jgi:hypothetical protein
MKYHEVDVYQGHHMVVQGNPHLSWQTSKSREPSNAGLLQQHEAKQRLTFVHANWTVCIAADY